jgi:DNA-binding NarL/FixJ family response regulator
MAQTAPATPPAPIRVLLAEDHQILRDGMRAVLSGAGLQVVGEARDGRQAVRLAQELAPDVVVMDISMPELNGIEASRRIRQELPNIRILALSMYCDRSIVKQMIEAGAQGFLSKECASHELVSAVQGVVANRFPLSPGIARQMIEDIKSARTAGASRPADALDERDTELVRLLAAGKNTKEIAVALKLSPKTVDIYRRRLMLRLKLASLADLTKFAIRKGLASLDL